MVPTDLIVVGKIFDSYGLQGWLKINPFEVAQNSALLLANQWWIQHLGAEQWTMQAASGARPHITAILAKLDCCSTREQALTFKGASIALSRSQFPKPADAEFYWIDLVGSQVNNREGQALGQVRMIDHHGAHAILYVSHPNSMDAKAPADERLIPFVDAYIDKVDIEQKRILVDWQLDY